MNLPDLLNAPVAVDTETTGLYPDQGARITTVSVATEGFEDVWDVRKMSPNDYLDLISWLSRQKLIYQNAKFDMTMFLRGFPDNGVFTNLESRFYWDTKEATGLLWPVGPWKLNEKNHKKEYTTSLKPVSEWLWGKESTQAERELKAFLESQPKHLRKRYDLVPWDIHKPYALQDAKLTYRLFKEQYPKVDYALLDREFQFEKVLYRMETRGIGFDAERGREVAEDLRGSLRELTAQLPVRPTRDQFVKYWWEDHDGAPDWIPRTEKTDKVQLNEYHLWKLAQLGYPFAQLYYDYEQIKSMMSKVYTKWPDKVGADGRIRVDYQQNGTITGRLAGRNIPLQGIPQDFSLSKAVPSVRKLFIPKRGCKLWGIDLSQAELRIAASVAKCKIMREQFNKGMDVHGETAKTIFHITETNPEWKKHRYISKTTNFAVLYTAGPDRLVEQITHEGKIDFTLREANKIRRAHRELYPEFYSETDIAANKAKERGYITTVSGRRIYWQPWEHRFYKAFNNVIQGNVAEFAKDWMIWVDHNYPGILLLQVHDEIILEVPIGSENILQEIKQWTEETASDLFHIKMVADVNLWGINAYEEK